MLTGSGAVERAVFDEPAHALPPDDMSTPHEPAFGNPVTHFRHRKERNFEIHNRLGILDGVELLLIVRPLDRRRQGNYDTSFCIFFGNISHKNSGIIF
jgi:hypothetical protein